MAVTQFLVFVLAQVAADFFVRTRSAAGNRQYWQGLVLRSVVIGGVVVVLDIASRIPLSLPLVAAVVAAHLLVDFVVQTAHTAAVVGLAWGMPLEQLLHTAANWGLALLAFPGVRVAFAPRIALPVPVIGVGQFWLVTATLFVLAVAGGAYWIPELLDRIMGQRPTLASDAPTGKSGDDYVRSGFYIGVLERTFLFLIVVFQQPVALGVLVALKSLARHKAYTDDAWFAERFLVGTLLSFLIAMVPAGMVLMLYQALV